MDWRTRAHCRRAPSDIFMPGSEEVERAKAICASCPVASPCLAYALESGASGIYGGLDDDERTLLYRRATLADGRVTVSWTQFQEHPSGDLPDRRRRPRP